MSASAFAADVIVSPGTGTLTAALNNVASGDTLILQEGFYHGDVVVNNSVTLRAQSRGIAAVITGTLTLGGGPNTRITVQGLDIRNVIYLLNSKSIRLLENWIHPVGWLGIDAILMNETTGLGSLVIIGNRIDSEIAQLAADGAYIAGNIITSTVNHAGGNAWIVGNTFAVNGHALLLTGDNRNSRIVGNRMQCGSACVISSYNGSQLVFNNVMYRPNIADQNGIIRATGGDWELRNNVFRHEGGELAVVRIAGTIRMEGNIILSSEQSTCCSGNPTPAALVSNHNLCFGPEQCAPGVGNLSADPQLLDLVDYRLANTSPAKDAGTEAYQYADLDRTRNDIGIYGGPWSIDQFDIQRDPQNLAPFVYPVFSGGSHIGGGQLQLQAIGASRLR